MSLEKRHLAHEIALVSEELHCKLCACAAQYLFLLSLTLQACQAELSNTVELDADRDAKMHHFFLHLCASVLYTICALSIAQALKKSKAIIYQTEVSAIEESQRFGAMIVILFKRCIGGMQKSPTPLQPLNQSPNNQHSWLKLRR